MPRHDELRWLRINTATRASRRADEDAKPARTRRKESALLLVMSVITPQKQKVGQGLGLFARQRVEASLQPRPQVKRRIRAHAPRSPATLLKIPYQVRALPWPRPLSPSLSRPGGSVPTLKLGAVSRSLKWLI